MSRFCATLFVGIWGLALGAQDIEKVIQEKALDFSGSIGGSYHTYAVEGIAPQSNPNFWNLYGELTPSIFGFKAPLRFTVGRQERSFDRPFVQLGLSPSYRWATLHLGTRNMLFSKYTLANHSFDGVGFELTPGNWRFSAMYGRLRRAIEYDSTDLNSRFRTQYRRWGYGAKIGYGGEKALVELSYFKAWDEAASLKVPLPDSSLGPAENAVVGLNLSWTLGKRLDLYSEVALSAFTRHTDDPLQLENTDNPIITANLTTRLNYAGEAGLAYTFNNGRVNLSYQRIMPEYESMGAYFFANDISNLKIAPSFRFFRNKLNLSAALNLQNNNLQNSRLETTERIFGNANLSYIHNEKWGFNGNVMSNSTNQTEARLNRPDSVRLASIANTFGLTPYWNIAEANALHSLSLSLNYSDLNDRNVLTREFSDFRVSTVLFNWVNTRLSNGRSINAGLNVNRMEFYQVENVRYGATIGYSCAWKEGTWSVNTSNTFNLSTVNQASDGFTNTLNANLSYTLARRHTFNYQLNLLYNRSEEFQTYTELRMMVSYAYRF